MAKTGAIAPTDDQLQAFLAADWQGPLTMINLLKFADQADYGEADEPARTGEEAYTLYSELATPFVMGVGGSLLFSSDISQVLIGEASENWDRCLIVQYPSRQAFVDMTSNPDYQAIAYHRSAALSRSALLPSVVTTP